MIAGQLPRELYFQNLIMIPTVGKFCQYLFPTFSISLNIQSVFAEIFIKLLREPSSLVCYYFDGIITNYQSSTILFSFQEKLRHSGSTQFLLFKFYSFSKIFYVYIHKMLMTFFCTKFN